MKDRRSRTRRRLGAIAVALLVVLLGACAREAPQDSLWPAGTVAERVGGLWTLVFGLAVVVFVVVEGLLIYAIVRFRRRRRAEAEEAPRQVHGNTRLEVAWTIAPALLLLFVAVPTVAEIFNLSGEPDDALHVNVTAHQFWWEYTYEQGGEELVTANELHIPVGQPVMLTLESDDVIHSFWVPRLAGKQDVVPGRQNTLWLDANEPGTYRGQCAEFCGAGHAYMRFRVIASEPGDFEQWLEEQAQDAAEPTEAEAVEGQRVFMEAPCVGCHTIQGTDAEGVGGPNLTHIGSRQTVGAGLLELNEENLRRWITDAPSVKPQGSPAMPTAEEMGLSEEEVDQIVAYLLSLRREAVE